MNIQNISNETIHKLNASEIGELGLVNHGVFTYHGELKTRKQGFKREVVSDWQTNFYSSNDYRVEFIKIEQTSEKTDYAMRVYDMDNERYSEMFHILFGCDFFR